MAYGHGGINECSGRRLGTRAVTLALVVLSVNACQQRDGHSSDLIAPARVIPSQSLRLTDGNGSERGSLFVDTNSTRILDADELTIGAGSGATGELECEIFSYEAPNGGQTLKIDIEPELAVTRLDDGKAPVTVYGALRLDHNVGWGTIIMTEIWCRMSGCGRSYTPVRNAVPTEDVRLVGADGHLLAVLGLSVTGNPTIALVGHSEHIQAVWYVNSIGGSGVQLFDQRGQVRAIVTLIPGTRPELTIFPPLPYGQVKRRRSGA
jgi:hypothetical protein